MPFQLHRPAGIDAAVALAGALGPEARYLAGGSDLMIQINRRRCAPAHLIALDRIAGLSGTETGGDRVTIGATTTMKTVERHPDFGDAPMAALAEAACVVGGHQVRNVATVGGNIVNASPAADLLPVLLALDAEIELTGSEGMRRLPLAQFLRGPGLTAQKPGELLVRVSFAKPGPASASTFLKAGRRRAMEISVVCVAAVLELDEDGRCRDARIALGAVDPTAIRAAAAEALLRGREPDAVLFWAAGDAAAAVCAPIDDVRASAWYRRRLVAVLVSRALQRCRERIGGRA